MEGWEIKLAVLNIITAKELNWISEHEMKKRLALITKL